MQLFEPTVELIHVTPDSEMLLEKAIRVCYNSFDKCDGSIECARKLIKKIISMWHVDTLEHATATFRIVCSRAAMAQFTRHRMASFGVQSQRYVKYDEPWALNVSVEESGKEFYEEFMKICHEAYTTLLAFGWKKENARGVLPQNWGTEFYVTMNFRSWRHFISLRSEKSAQWEIRTLSDKILEELMKHAPSVFEDIKEGPEEENASEHE